MLGLGPIGGRAIVGLPYAIAGADFRWYPLSRKGLAPLPPPPYFQGHHRHVVSLGIRLDASDPLWFSLRTHIHTMPGEAAREPSWTLAPKWNPLGVDPGTQPERRVAAFRVHCNDAESDPRTRVMQQATTAVLNGLLRSGQLNGSMRNPSLGFAPDDQGDWAPGKPTTVWEALDRIARMLRIMNGGVGP